MGRSGHSTLEAAEVSLVRPKDEGERWVKLTLVTMGIWVALFVTMAVIPSFWLYFADGTLKWTGTFSVPYGFGELTLPMQAVRDVVVVIWYGVALGAFGLAIYLYNKRNPRTLPSGEEKREATGGYK
ncbi:MAG TPA: hypothetical protein VFQ49_13585 [Actinomycetes bacterium]|nr:hypothetical protein [Actinomycetes bacterium]